MPNNQLSHSTITPRWIQWSLLLLVFILPFNEGGNGYIVQTITQLILLACVVMWAFHVIRTRQLHIRYTWIDIVILAGLAWIGVSLVFSEYRYATILEGIKVLSYAALWFVSRTIITSQATRTLVLCSIVGSGCLQFCIALYRTVINKTPGWPSGFVNPNEFACLLVIGLHIALSFLLFRTPTSESTTQPARLRRALAAFMLVAAGMAIGMLPVLQSRGALLSFAVTGFVLATLRHKFAGLAFLLILATIIVLPLPHGSVAQRLSKSHDPFAYQRLDIWSSSAKMVLDHPVLGVGLGMFPYYGAAYNFPVEHQIARYGKRLDLAHNDLLHISAELGIVGLLLIAAIIVNLGILSVRHLRSRSQKTHPPTPSLKKRGEEERRKESNPPKAFCSPSIPKRGGRGVSSLSWQVTASSAGLLGLLVNGLVSNLLLSPALVIMGVLLAGILLECTATFTHKTWTIPERAGIVASWYGALALGVIYILVPVIGYPFFAHSHFLRYQEYRREGRVAEAVEHLRKAIRYVPIQAYYHQAFGQLYAAAFRNQPNLDAYYEAYTSLTEAIRHNPRESQFYMTLADLHRTTYREILPNRPAAENALREYARALDVDPYNPFIRAEMATLSADIGEFDQAITIIRHALTDEPNFVRGYQLLGEFLRHLGREDEANEAFANADRIRQTYPSSENKPEYTQSLLKSLY